ncbi:hypothetical protein MtrunA17_Chr3g0139251 [Medicago truncatula]|uniref:Uncharacterized protein n=1 Tax=Medicago truncatula TaxID=3880 RepID=A0A396J2Z8_MEDTR|nr:hypothetical protein MtrunA17_Chr3g0139251 [Medicago truncatula]
MNIDFKALEDNTTWILIDFLDGFGKGRIMLKLKFYSLLFLI